MYCLAVSFSPFDIFNIFCSSTCRFFCFLGNQINVKQSIYAELKMMAWWNTKYLWDIMASIATERNGKLFIFMTGFFGYDLI